MGYAVSTWHSAHWALSEDYTKHIPEVSYPRGKEGRYLPSSLATVPTSDCSVAVNRRSQMKRDRCGRRMLGVRHDNEGPGSWSCPLPAAMGNKQRRLLSTDL